MKLNRLEFIAMNNPVRAFIQDKYEGRVLREMAPVGEIGRSLEIGCGRGVGTRSSKNISIPAPFPPWTLTSA